jgi:hypothetical protein
LIRTTGPGRCETSAMHEVDQNTDTSLDLVSEVLARTA